MTILNGDANNRDDARDVITQTGEDAGNVLDGIVKERVEEGAILLVRHRNTIFTIDRMYQGIMVNDWMTPVIKPTTKVMAKTPPQVAKPRRMPFI